MTLEQANEAFSAAQRRYAAVVAQYRTGGCDDATYLQARAARDAALQAIDEADGSAQLARDRAAAWAREEN